jgi:hypothetical protein
MSIFSFITEKLGISSAAAEEVPETEPSASTVAPVEVSDTEQPAPVLSSTISEVDVVSKLEELADSHAEKLNWKVSIVDFLKLLGLESSLTTRKELAQELGCPAEKMGDSAQMNVWLHKTVLQKLAQNGGNIPPDLLD